MPDNLTDKQQVWLETYLTCWNATEAARQAGYAFPNVEGPKNLVNPSLRSAISARLAELAMPADEVLARLGDQARGDMAEFLSLSGRGVRLDIAKAIKAGKGHLIKKYSRTEKGVAVELYDGQAALVHIGRHHGLFVDKTALTDPTGTKEYADATLEALRQRLITQLTARPADAGTGDLSSEPDAGGDEEAAL